MARQKGELRSAIKLAYLGTKLRFADQINQWMPNNCDTLIEPYGGMGAISQIATVHQQWKRIVWNDLAPANVNLFKTIRDDHEGLAKKLATKITEPIYLFCRDHHSDPNATPLERAWRWLVTLNHGRYSAVVSGSGFQYVQRFEDMAEHLPLLSLAFQRIEMRSEPAVNILREFNRPNVFALVDPPYLDEVRRRYEWSYPVEMTPAAHVELLDLLNELDSFVMLCGKVEKHTLSLPTIYRDRLGDWVVHNVKYRTDKTEERVWLNYDLE